MPFKSEKQRRFLWAAHPELAKRWAHEYPTKKKLPMYASDEKKDTKLDTDSKQADFSPGAAARDTAAAAGLSTLGTTAGLAAAGMLSKRIGSPMLQKLFQNAARESVLFFNPKRSYKLLKRLPNAAVLSARQLELSDKLVNAKLPKTFANVNKSTVNKATKAFNDVQQLQNQTQRYVKQHGELPTETLEKGIGVANGVMNLGVGGVVGFLPHVTGTASQSPINAAFANKPNMTTYKQSAVNSVALDIYRKLSKQADTKEVYIEQPASDKPTVAGENPPKVVKTKGERCNSETKPNYGVNTLMAKLSAVLSQPIMQAIENERAEMEARMAARMPANAGIKRYAMPAMGTPLPMGMQAQAPQGQPQAPAAQPANTGSPAPSGQLPSVGGGSSPNANPINSYGALSSTGDITGNAAFGTANSVGGEKMAAPEAKKKEPAKPGLGHSMGWYLGGMPATNAAIGLPLTAYMNRVARPEMNAAPTLESSQAWQQLSDYAKGQGVDVTDSLNVASKIDPKIAPKTTGNWLGDFMNNIKYRMRRSAADSVRNTPAFYTPANPGMGISKPTIGHSPRMSNPGVLAHEIGHHMGGKWLMRGNQIGRPALGLGTAAALLSNNEDNSRNSAIAGTAGAVPMLASEFDASRRGAKLMRQMKLKGGRSAFVGLPTYMLASSAPMLAHYGKKTLGGFKADAAARQMTDKKAGVYRFDGDVQGVNLRKSLHTILDELDHPGIAYNNARTGEARAVLPGNKKKQQAVLDRLRKHLAERENKTPLQEGVHYSITPLKKQVEKLHPITMTPDDINTFIATQQFDRLAKETPEYHKKWLKERYRLQPQPDGSIAGAVPTLAKQQLLAGEPVYDYQLKPGWPDAKEKSAGLVSGAMGLGRRLGFKGLSKGVTAARQSFRGPMTTLGDSVPEGILHAERNQALQAGNEFLSSFKPQGFQTYAGRVKTPGSIAGHGTDQVTNDLLGFRLSSSQGYGQSAVDSLTKQLTDAGVQITGSKMLMRPGYHGHNIKGTLKGSPVEFQLSPRRLQGMNAADHSMVYKPQESGVNPTLGKMVYGPAIRYGMTVASPMVPMAKRVGYGAAGVGGVAAAGTGAAYAANR